MNNKYICIDVETDRVIAAEQQVLGCILTRNSIFPDVVSELKPEHFTAPHNRIIYEAMLKLYEQSIPIHYEAVYEIVRKYNSNPPITRSNIIELMEGATDWAVIKWNVDKILKFSKASEMKSLVNEARELLEDPDNTASAAMLMQSAVDIIAEENKKEVCTATDKMTEIMEELDKINRGLVDPGLSTHIDDLNRIVRFKPGQLIVIGARTGEGKTSLLMNISEHVAFNQSANVLFFSLEMTAHELFTRQLLSRAKIPSDRFLSNIKISPSSWKDIVAAKDYIESNASRLIVCEKAGLSPLQIRSITKKVHHVNKLGMVAIDYLTFITPDRIRASSTREQEVASIIRSLKILAKELMIPVIVCAQLSRDLDKSEKRREPRLSDLRESGAIEQDADIVILIHHPDKDSPTAKIHVAKNRHGKTGKLEVAWLPQYVRFEALDIHHE